MNWLDLAIVVLLLGSLARGVELGVVRQVLSAVGFFGGLFLGAALGGKVLTHVAHEATSRGLLSLALTFGCAMFFSAIGEYVGALAKEKLQHTRLDVFDRVLGSVVGGVTLLAGVWLGASLLANMPAGALQKQVRGSAIVATLDKHLPAAPGVVTKIGRLIEPNGFPQVFTGLEPKIPTNTPLPSIGQLDAAVQQDRASVVKIEGRGCGGIVEGSGFVAGDGLVATNAHVVAGVAQPMILDANGEHHASVVWFDPNLDFAVLRTSNLAGAPLRIAATTVGQGTSAAVLGYPGGGDFTASPAAVLDAFTAVGRNIYNQGVTRRNIYSVKATVVPGNSGGPLVLQDGSVAGVVFAQSTVYDQVGYALTTQAISQELAAAGTQTQAIATGSCAED